MPGLRGLNIRNRGNPVNANEDIRNRHRQEFLRRQKIIKNPNFHMLTVDSEGNS